MKASASLAAVLRKIAGVITAIENGGDPRSLALRINALEAERRDIEAKLASGPSPDTLAYHPRIAERYRQKVADIHAALSKGDEAAREAVSLVRELIERIIVTPTDARRAVEAGVDWEHFGASCRTKQQTGRDIE